jgi:hypothetical protein
MVKAGASTMMERLAQGLMRRTHNKKADRYREHIDELVELMDPTNKDDGNSPSPRKPLDEVPAMSKTGMTVMSGSRP